ncbi:MAG: DNA repair protein RadC [bacterium]
MKKYLRQFPIRQWAEEDRPREKLLLKGRHALSDAELLGILIGSGTAEDSAVGIAQKILADMQENLSELGRLGISELQKYKGVGPARAVTITAALELGKRRNESVSIEKAMVKKSEDAYQIFKTLMGDKAYEEFWILLLNRGNRLLRRCCISEGGISGTVVDPKKIFKIALDHHASSIILGHNHPSGNPKPSESDIRITTKIMDAGKLLEVAVLDHIVVADDSFFSFADNGML